jgi:hypothetical protein
MSRATKEHLACHDMRKYEYLEGLGAQQPWRIKVFECLARRALAKYKVQCRTAKALRTS